MTEGLGDKVAGGIGGPDPARAPWQPGRRGERGGLPVLRGGRIRDGAGAGGRRRHGDVASRRVGTNLNSGEVTQGMAAFSEDRVKQIIVDQLGVAPEQVTRGVVHRRSRSRLARHGGAGHGPRGGVRHRDPRRGREKMTTVADAHVSRIPRGQERLAGTKAESRPDRRRVRRKPGARRAAADGTQETEGANGPMMVRRAVEPRRVVVTGMGIISPLGSDVGEFWKRLTAGESGSAPSRASTPPDSTRGSRAR